MDTEATALALVFSVSTTFRQPIRLAIEPWGDQCQMTPGDSVRLEMLGPEGGVPEVMIEPGGITVLAWDGSTCNGWRGAQQVLHGGNPFPPGTIDVLRRVGLVGEPHSPDGDS